MLHAQALVYSDDPSALGERIARDLAGAYRTVWAAEAGNVTGADGFCDLHSWPEALRLDAFAETEAALARVENVISSALAAAAPGVAQIDWYRRPSA